MDSSSTGLSLSTGGLLVPFTAGAGAVDVPFVPAALESLELPLKYWVIVGWPGRAISNLCTEKTRLYEIGVIILISQKMHQRKEFLSGTDLKVEGEF